MYLQREVVACLQRGDVMAGDLPVRVGKYPATYPPGVLGAVQFFTGLGPKIDGGELFFFKSSSSAKAGESKLVSVFLYGRGLPAILQAAVKSQGKIAAGSARFLYRQSGNVVLIWNHPRRDVAFSNRLVDSCLSSSRGA